ncbi:c(7)-type cytochrome triheme domain-containing protein [Geothermobacter hydrogeniphilus]|uniref:Cytochrome c7-like domain-containing protein n=1 Tax=Geothermobacter hydrogeniphilus TaxID=1969733 RepID=A0A1X0YDB5_9BACT|nr:c(7)-type cytochrome triheme domain-containing protein [Geothermobacter hydrogeniphilus]ORJ62964.1 hypothetical protein B5V00_02625 [Geothermobacter hydrogeniphilus]
MKKLVTGVVLLLVAAGFSVAGAETFGVKKKRPKLSEFGRVVIDNGSTAKGQAAVAFPHWLHRSKFTCRLCHVDLGFAMQAGATGITEADNRAGLYCGACHDGKLAFAAVTTGTDGVKQDQCERCHSVGKNVKFKNDFNSFRRTMPRERFGNGIDWLKAEEEGLLKLVDYREGYSVHHAKIQDPEDIDLSAKEDKMPDIIFSHRKHAVWNGCETCHPEIFPIRKGAKPYSMQDIFDGRFCGVCHDKVAFPNIDCQRCHSRPVF